MLKVTRLDYFNKLEHANKAIDSAKKIGLEIVNIRAEHIVDMKEASVIGLMNQIMRQCPKEKPAKKISPQPQP